MAAPLSYTEVTLAEYMHRVLGLVADVLGFSPGGDTDGRASYQEAVNDALIAYGVSDIASATNIQKLRTLAEREAWRLCLQAAGEFDFSSAGTSESRGQLYAHIEVALARAEGRASAYDPAAGVVVTPMRYVHDPYQAAIPDEMRVLP